MHIRVIADQREETEVKAAIVTPFRSFAGGQETVNAYLEQVLRKCGYEVEYVTSEGLPTALHMRLLRILFGTPVLSSCAFKRLSDIFDLLICSGQSSFGIRHRKAIVLHHNSYFAYYRAVAGLVGIRTILSMLRNSILQVWGSRNKYVVTVSELARQGLERQGVKVDLIIENGVNTNLFFDNGYGDRSGYLCVASSNYYEKGFDILERLADYLKITVVTNKEPSGKLLWISTVENNQMAEIYNQFKILLFPSRYEAMQMVPLEAMACGMPVIMSNVGFGPELKREIPEFVVDGWNDIAIAEYLKRAAIIEGNYREYARRAREYVVKHNSLEQFERKWVDLIKSGFIEKACKPSAAS
jgi:glycosyltransferase involved in cell wall biosynthesis